MRNGLIVGMAIGAIVGAALVEGNKAASNMVSKSKKAVKSKMDQLNGMMD